MATTMTAHPTASFNGETNIKTMAYVAGEGTDQISAAEQIAGIAMLPLPSARTIHAKPAVSASNAKTRCRSRASSEAGCRVLTRTAERR